MRRKFLVTQTMFLTLTLGLTPIGCLSLQPDTKIIDISNIDMQPVNAKVRINVDTYQDVLASDSSSSFKSNLIKTLNDFASDNDISLRYAEDYNFSFVDKNIDPYSVITKYETLILKVTATNHNPKIKGMFRTPVNFIKRPKSITEIVIPTQKFNTVVIDKTTLLDALRDSCFEVIKNNIRKFEPKAVRWTDYTVNVESHNREDKITENDLGIQYVNVNAIESTGLLEGNFSFALILSVPEPKNN